MILGSVEVCRGELFGSEITSIPSEVAHVCKVLHWMTLDESEEYPNDNMTVRQTFLQKPVSQRSRISYSLYTSNYPVSVQQDSDLDLALDNGAAMAINLWLDKETIPQVIKVHLVSRHIPSDK